jgi:hypothetical protein
VGPAAIAGRTKAGFSPVRSAGKIVCTDHKMVNMGGKGRVCAGCLCHDVTSGLMCLGLIVNEKRRFSVYSWRLSTDDSDHNAKHQ